MSENNTMLVGISGKKGHGKDTVADIMLDLILDKNSNDVIQKKSFGEKIKEMIAALLGVSVEAFENRKWKEADLGDDWATWTVYSTQLNKNSKGYSVWDKEKMFPTELEAKTCLELFHTEHLNMGIESKLKITRTSLTPRKLLQSIGTDWGRELIDYHIWIRALFAPYSSNDRWTIPDLRFPNEFSAIKSRGGLNIRVVRYQSSDKWYQMFKEHFSISDPDGWNRIDYDYSWNKELISQEEFFKRVSYSTCVYNPSFAELKKSIEHYSETALDHYKYSDWDYILINDGTYEDLVEAVKKMCETWKLI